MENKFNVRNGKLYYGKKQIGDSEEKPGFNQYIFDNEPLGNGANGITFGVTHKILNVRQVIKIYFPKDDDNNTLQKAKEESIKNANTDLTGIVAVTFDAGEYMYPCKLWYSVMESVSSYCTIKQWRKKRDVFFKSNKSKFDIENIQCRSSLHTSINLAAGFLKTIVCLYDKGIIHGDLNPGNILWIFDTKTIDESLEKYASSSYSDLGELSPYNIKLIDMGASKVNIIKEAGNIRDSWKIYEHMKSFLSPLFQTSKNRFEKWMNFELIKLEECKEYGVDKICSVKKGNNVYYISPKELAGDFFRLLCVLTIALGIITNNPSKKENSIFLDEMDRRDFFVLMYEMSIEDAIKAISFESMIILKKLDNLGSGGRLINWEKVWKSYPFNRINIAPVFK